jgi:predicted PurR-regulated permease PerM
MTMDLRLLTAAATILIFLILGYLLWVGKQLLIPLAVAVFIWYLLNAIARMFTKIQVRGYMLPGWLRVGMALLIMGASITFIGNLIFSNISAVQDAAPAYADNLRNLAKHIPKQIGPVDVPSLDGLLEEIDLKAIIGNLVSTLAGLAGDIGVVIIYVAFLMLEQKSFHTKLNFLFKDPQKRKETRAVLNRIQKDIQTYIWIKTLLSVLTGVLSYTVLVAVGVDLAAFWAVIIFMLNYIPTIGSLLGILFPAVLTLVQFDTTTPFLIVTPLLAGIQVVVGNVLEPNLMGRSLNLSSLVVILSLTLWGSLWGIVGAFLCVPLMVIIMIVLAQFPRTQPIAVLLSNDGRI